jgi:hypothetical protein
VRCPAPGGGANGISIGRGTDIDWAPVLTSMTRPSDRPGLSRSLSDCAQFGTVKAAWDAVAVAPRNAEPAWAA